MAQSPPFNFRLRVGQETFDSPLYSVRPKPVRTLRQLPSGASLVVQEASALGGHDVLEALVGERSEESLLILPDGTRHTDIHYGSQVVQPKSDLGVVFLGETVTARFVNRPNRARMVHIILPPGLRSVFSQDVPLHPFDGRYVDAHSKAKPLLLQFSADCEDVGAPDMMLDTYVALIIQKLSMTREARIGGGLAPRHLRRTIEMMSDPGRNVSLLDLAGEAQLSPSHFARAFKESTGVPPHQYQLRRRLELASELLRTTRQSIEEIAARAGFDDQGYFARVFRKSYGLAPTRYRAAFHG